MQALTFNLSIPRMLLARTLGRRFDSFLYGAPSSLSLREQEPPALPGPGWVRLEVIAGGICGSDLSLLSFDGSPTREVYFSYPCVLGHEILARVVEVGSFVSQVSVGQRVAVDPLIGCQVRGYQESEICASCADGQPATCARAGDASGPLVNGEPLARGNSIGFHRHLPGSWGEQMLAHHSQLHPVDDGIDDQAAALIEPLAVSVRGALRNLPQRGDDALVIGSGPIALATIWALRALGFEGNLVAQMKRPRESELAKRLGASEVIRPGAAARQRLLDTGANPHKPIIGGEIFLGGGFPYVFDCVGKPGSLDQAMRFATARGTVVLLGCAGVVPRLDVSFIWGKELSVRGSYVYGREQHQGQELHTYALTQRLLRKHDAPIGELVTSSYPIARRKEALGAAFNRQRAGDLKVLLTP